VHIPRTIVSALVAVGIAMGSTACSSNDGQANAGADASSSEVKPGEPYPGYSASLEPDPTSLEAETVEPTESAEESELIQEPEPTPTPDVDSDVARAANLTPCETALDRKVIDATVRGTSKVSLDEVVVNKPNASFIKYSETCTYTVHGTDVAYVTSMLLTTSGKERYRNACSGDQKFDDVLVKPIGYQYYSHVDDGCTLVPKSSAPKGTLPGFVLRYRDKMVIVRMAGFDKVANDGKAVIKKVTLKS
jgi:hypothetical protein